MGAVGGLGRASRGCAGWVRMGCVCMGGIVARVLVEGIVAGCRAGVVLVWDIRHCFDAWCIAFRVLDKYIISTIDYRYFCRLFLQDFTISILPSFIYHHPLPS
jgi:hypothetical protein